jgi:hypothetical protein
MRTSRLLRLRAAAAAAAAAAAGEASAGGGGGACSTSAAACASSSSSPARRVASSSVGRALLLPLAAAAAMAAAAAAATPTLAEAPPPAAAAATVTDEQASAALAEAWQEAADDWARAAAEAGGPVPPALRRGAPRPHVAPDGAGRATCCVDCVSPRNAAALDGVVRRFADVVGAAGVQRSVESHNGRRTTRWTLRGRFPAVGLRLSERWGAVDGGDAYTGRLEAWKEAPGAPLSAAEAAFFAALVATAVGREPAAAAARLLDGGGDGEGGEEFPGDALRLLGGALRLLLDEPSLRERERELREALRGAGKGLEGFERQMEEAVEALTRDLQSLDGGQWGQQLPLPPARSRAAASQTAAPSVPPPRDTAAAAAAAAVRELEALGAQVFPPTAPGEGTAGGDWGLLAGYQPQKRALEDGLLLPLSHAEVYDGVARATRAHFASPRPRAVLLEGPPGTGKTTSARVMARRANAYLVYVPLESVSSKWYGEAEQRLATVFRSAEALGGAIIFLDELDSLATSRDGDMHEVTRRLLSVLLREIDGFAARRSVVIGATNRKGDLDPALLSRCARATAHVRRRRCCLPLLLLHGIPAHSADPPPPRRRRLPRFTQRFSMSITFPLPDAACRADILRQYARQLGPEELARLAEATEGMSGRDLRDIAETAERRWAAKLIRGEAGAEGAATSEPPPPPAAEYRAAAETRAAERATV